MTLHPQHLKFLTEFLFFIGKIDYFCSNWWLKPKTKFLFSADDFDSINKIDPICKWYEKECLLYLLLLFTNFNENLYSILFSSLKYKFLNSKESIVWSRIELLIKENLTYLI